MQPAIRLPLGLALLCAGCFVDAPGESGSGGASGAGTTVITGPGTSDDPTSSSSTGTTSSSTGSTSSTSSTGEPMTSSGTTLATSSTTGEGSTTAGELPNPLVIPADIAACVLLEHGQYGHLGPDACSDAATGHNGTETQGVLVLDAQFQVSMDRPAQIYLRFPLPPELAQVTVTGVELTMMVADGLTAGGWIGELRRVAPFSLADLNTAAPTPLTLLLEDPGVAVDPGATVSRALPPKVFVEALKIQSLHLGILPVDLNGSLYHGQASGPDLQPNLVITHE